MKIRLKHKSVVITQAIRVAYNHKTKKSVDLDLEGDPGSFELTTDSIDVAADCLVNRGWELVQPPVLAVPVIRNEEGLQHPEEFVFTAKSGRLSREQVQEAAAKVKQAAAKNSDGKKPEDVKPSDAPPAGGSASPDAPKAGGDEAAA